MAASRYSTGWLRGSGFGRRSTRTLRRTKEAVRALFDARWYLDQNADVAAAGVEPLTHYLEHGWREGRAPHPLFDAAWYLSRNEDVAAVDTEPLLHYLTHGWREGRSPHPLFDAGWYLGQNADVVSAGIEPLTHYLRHGWREGRWPHPLFDVSRYLAQHRDVAAAGCEPLCHYLWSGWREGRDPSPFFDLAWYLDRNRDVVSAETEPLSHYLKNGWQEGRAPHLLFDVMWYLDQNQDVATAGAEPLSHYVASGWREEREPSAVFARALTLLPRDVSERRPKQSLANVFEFFRGNRDLLEAEVWAARENVPVTGSRFELINCRNDYKDKNVCLFACHCPSGRLEPATALMVKWIRDSGFAVVCVAATDNCSSFEIPEDDPEISAIVRGNVGYDFAGWALALCTLPTLWSANSLLFANDSVFGPIDSLDNRLIHDMMALPADCVALTASRQGPLHFQSYFFLAKRKILESTHFRAFWSSVRIFYDQRRIIEKYEVNLLSVIIMSGVSCHVVFQSFCQNCIEPINPTLHHWRELIQAGFPFLKKRLVRDDIRGVDSQGWLETIRNAELRGLLGSYAEQDECSVL